MTAARESRGQRRYLKLHEGENGDFDPREGTRSGASATKQASELERARAQALALRQLPAKKLPAVAWIAHQLCTLARKSGVAC